MRLGVIIGHADGYVPRGLPMLALALAPGAAFAQAAPVRQFSISPQLRLSHDSNVLRLPDGVPTPAGRHRGDYRSSPSVAVNILRPLGRQQIFLSGSLGYDFYRYNKQLERERISLNGGATVSAGSCATTGQIGYARRQSDLEDIVVGGIGGTRNRETVVTPSLSVNCGSAGGLSSGLSYTHEDVSNSDPARAYGEYYADNFTARVGLARPALGDIGLYANYRRGVYENRILPNGVTEAVESFAAGLRADRQFGRIKGHVAGGITRVQPNTPGVRGFRGASYDVSLAYLTPRASARIGLARSVQNSNLLGVDYTITDNFDAGVTYRLNPRVVLNAGVTRTRRRLSQSPLAPVFAGDRADRSRSIDVGASFDAARHIGFSFGANWRKRQGSVAAFDYSARTLALTLRIH